VIGAVGPSAAGGAVAACVGGDGDAIALERQLKDPESDLEREGVKARNDRGEARVARFETRRKELRPRRQGVLIVCRVGHG
jgi:hypothetical protein